MSAPRVSSSDVKQYTDMKRQECPICRNSYTHQDFTRQRIHKTACEHFFHSKCLARWIKERVTCPVCIQKINFDAESASWKKFLLKVHAEVLQKFPDSTDCPGKLSDKLSDEDLALDLQEEEARKRQAEKQQIHDDSLLAMRLAQEVDNAPSTQHLPQSDPHPVP